MPVDQASATSVIGAPIGRVLAVIRDVASQPQWVKEITSVELLEEYEDGTPATAVFELTTMMGADHYTLEYEHGDEAMSWSLVKGGMQKAQNGSYQLRSISATQTEVTFSLEVEHSISAPGFIRKSIFSGLVQNTLAGLKKYVEASSD